MSDKITLHKRDIKTQANVVLGGIELPLTCHMELDKARQKMSEYAKLAEEHLQEILLRESYEKKANVIAEELTEFYKSKGYEIIE